ncbi:GNAT family N-acetyltransferase [Brevibacterium atlanticum]|uniref:GNAT family N-acetyltransferase n=1 Tax=Brevibacterium atlanticum TaxID=2697563 RepID=UPI001421A133|nr:GNAT family N-acetyltransferase [Brevibacterium atlanticum]
MTLPSWPAVPPQYGRVHLRPVEIVDIEMAQELSTDRYVPQTGTLPFNATAAEARAWIQRQQGRHDEGRGFSFTVATQINDRAIGHCGLWLHNLPEGQATAGYAIVPSSRRQGFAIEALVALTEFGWSIPPLRQITLLIEPWNIGSIRTAERIGYENNGIVAEQHEIGGTRRDVLSYALERPQ